MEKQYGSKKFYQPPMPELQASIYYLTTEEGGRKSYVRSGYRGQFYYDGRDWDAPQTFIGKDIVFPRETVDCYITTCSPYWHIGRFYVGKTFEIREGPKTVGRGIITEVFRNDFLATDAKIYFQLAWILTSIFHSEESDGSELTAILAYADYSNHTIVMYEEFIFSINYLLSIGLVTINRDRYATTQLFKDWWNSKFKEKQRIYLQKEIERVGKYIRKNYPLESNPFKNTLVRIERDTFQKTLDLYLKKL